MFTQSNLQKDLEKLGIDPKGTLLVHSSYTAIGETKNGADTVLDALIDYMKDGLLVFPTHTWATLNEDNNVYDPASEPSCVGYLSNEFLKREGVVRSLHPTHSVAAIGKDAIEYTKGEENLDTPCSRNGCYGKLYTRNAQILFIGCDLTKNTFLHSVEEWNDIPNRITDYCAHFYIRLPNGQLLSRRHHLHQPDVHPSDYYGKMEALFKEYGISSTGKFGAANCIFIKDAGRMADLTSACLIKNPALFDSAEPEADF